MIRQNRYGQALYEIAKLRADKSRLTLQVIQLRQRLELVAMLSNLPSKAGKPAGQSEP